jgi:hypothetical protein
MGLWQTGRNTICGQLANFGGLCHDARQKIVEMTHDYRTHN